VISNSRTVAPGFFNFEDPETDIHEPATEALFAKLIESLKPDLVHFNNFEGFTPRCVAIARERGARVIYSLHNYHPLCSQVHLLYRDRELCEDYDDGVRCTGCSVPPPKSAELRRRRAEGFAACLPHGHLLLKKLRSLQDFLRAARAACFAPLVFLKQWRERLASRSPQPQRLPQRDWEARGAAPSTERDPKAGERYVRRRAAFIDGLNRADVLLAVSNSVSDIYRKMGVESDRMIVSHIGTAIAEQPAPLRRRAPRKGDPLNVVYMGTTDPRKGLFVVLDALSTLPAEQLGRIRLYLWGLGTTDAQIGRRLDSLASRLGGLQVRASYRRDELPALLKEADFGLVPPLWWDCAPQVVFEMLTLGVPVIGARIGGIPDFVVDGVNGHLFEPGNVPELALRIGQLVDNPEQIE
jgi:glycosyltransferase involved in cell wall biosynthesis